MSDFSNYSSLIYRQTTSGCSTSGSAIAGLVKLEPPKISAPAIDARNHGSGIYPSKIWSGIVEIDDFSGTFSFDPTALTVLQSEMIAGTMDHFRIKFPNNQNWYFDALVSEIAPESAEATNPDLLTVKVSFTPSGSMVIV